MNVFDEIENQQRTFFMMAFFLHCKQRHEKFSRIQEEFEVALAENTMQRNAPDQIFTSFVPNVHVFAVVCTKDLYA